MSEPYDYSRFSNDSADLYKLLLEVEKYKAFIVKQDSVESNLKPTDIVSGNGLSMFGAEIFQFWLAALRAQNTDKAVFLEFAASVKIPVRNRDRGPDGLSWLGCGIYSVWCEALKQN